MFALALALPYASESFLVYCDASNTGLYGELMKNSNLSLVCEVTTQSIMLGMLKLSNSILDEIREG